MLLGLYSDHMLAAGKASGTLRTYLSKLGELERHHPDLLGVTKADLATFLAARRETHMAESRKSMLSAFRSFYGWAVDEELLIVDPTARLDSIPIPTSVPRVARDEVVQMGLLTADEELTALILLARYGCLRLEELTTLHTRQREFDLLRIRGKGDKVRLVPINDELMHALLVLERKNGPGFYFPGRSGRPHLHTQSVNKMITRHLGMNPHSLRHAGATAAYLATNDIEAVRLLLGHASIATTQRYLHIPVDRVRAAAAATVIRPSFSTWPSTTMAPTEPARVPTMVALEPDIVKQSAPPELVMTLLAKMDALSDQIRRLEAQGERAA